MLLKKLKLKNIRSYSEQEINFPDGSILLSGDIGSGKSTLLLAIEFALFGISKPGLSGGTLLRKGEVNATVELNFLLDGKEILVGRSLKKSKNGVVQGNGFLVINNLRKELTPVEIKTEIIELLGYPNELVSKNKNYIFRYTVYCPQEEMKLILQENPENRLDILRKVFNLDKYKKIREALFFYLKEMRIRSTVLKTRIEPLEEKKEKLKQITEGIGKGMKDEKELRVKLEVIGKELEERKLVLEEKEKRNKIYLDLRKDVIRIDSLKEEKKKQERLMKEREKEVKERLNKLTVDKEEEEIKIELVKFERSRNDFLERSSALKSKIEICQEQVYLLQEEIVSLSEYLIKLDEKKNRIIEIEEELIEKEKIKEKKEEIEEKLFRIKEDIGSKILLCNHGEKIRNEIKDLDECPTCLQKVSEEYKQGILGREEKKIRSIRTELKELEVKRESLQKEFLEKNQLWDFLIKKDNALVGLKAELEILKEKKKLLLEKKELLQKKVVDNNYLIKKLEDFKSEELELLQERIVEKQNLLQQIRQKEELLRNRKEVELRLQEIEIESKDLILEEEKLLQKLKQFSDLKEEIELSWKKMEELRNGEKDIFLEKAKVVAEKESLEKESINLGNEIKKLQGYDGCLNKLLKTHYWLDKFLVGLTYTIEKQIMMKIYHLFNSLFQEWFGILIEDENISSHLDDSFTPVVEQNGYEINFHNLSGGERTAASLAYRLALNKVINDVITEIRTKDLLILDEPTDGFSLEQLDKVRDVLERLGLAQILVVSHESKIESFVENVLRVEKEEGKSTVFI